MKNSQKLYNSITEIDDRYIDEALNYKTVKKRPLWHKIGAVAACLVIAGTAVFTFGSAAKPNNQIGASVSDGTASYDVTTQKNYDSTEQDRKMPLISSIENIGLYDGKYQAPENGELFYSIPLRKAIEKYNEKAVYKTTLDIFSDGENLEINSDKVSAEIKRLNALGYKTEINNNQIIIYATYKQLTQFEKYNGFGYFFFLYDEWEH